METKHYIQLSIDNNGDIGSELVCSNLDECVVCGTNYTHDIWEDDRFDALRSSKELELGKVEVSIDTSNSEEIWFDVVHPKEDTEEYSKNGDPDGA